MARVLTVRQPWASLIMAGLKTVENRTRQIVGAHRGPLLIHAGKQPDPDAAALLKLIGARLHRDDLTDWAHSDLPTGVILGQVTVADVHQAWDCASDVLLMAMAVSIHGGHYRPAHPHAWCLDGHWHIDLTDPKPWDQPVPARGRFGLWHWTPEETSS
jgi:hypothetical protein